jgi:hypothetical protein
LIRFHGQWLKRMVEFSDQIGKPIQLLYYPPYPSKYNPIKRCWGILEQHWNGTQLKDVETMLKWAQSMTWKGIHPIVKLIYFALSQHKPILRCPSTNHVNHALLATLLIAASQRLAIEGNQLSTTDLKHSLHPVQKTLLHWLRSQSSKQSLCRVVGRYPMR